MYSLRHGRWLTILTLLAVVCLSVPASAAVWTWDATGLPGWTWDTDGQWTDLGTPSFFPPGEDLVFGASTNTNVLAVAGSNAVYSMTFGADAPAYTFSSTGQAEVEVTTGGTLANNSSNVQTFTADDLSGCSLKLAGCTVDATGGDATSGKAFEIASSLATSGTITINGDYLVNVTGAWSGEGFTKAGTGTLVLGGSSEAMGIVNIGSATSSTTLQNPGAIRIAHDNALGVGGSTSADYVNIYGNYYANGRLELAGGITTNEGIRLYARQDDQGVENQKNVAILNVSGDNTMTGPFVMQAGGAFYNFGSLSGKLTVTSNITINSSSDRRVTFQGDGDGEFSGKIAGGSTNQCVAIHKLGSGTLTLSGSENAKVGYMIVEDGTLAFGANAVTWTWAATTDSTGGPPRILLASGSAALDVSAIAGGYTLPVSLLGRGTVVGDVVVPEGNAVMPGDSAVINPDEGRGWKIIGWAAGAGQLSFDDNLDMSSGGTMEWNLAALSETVPGTDFDQLVVGGDLTLGGTSGLSLDFSLLAEAERPDYATPNAFWTSNHSWKIIDLVGGEGATTGNFASIANGTFDVGTFSTLVDANDVYLAFTASSVTPTIPGDTDGDNIVDDDDAAVVAGNWGQDVGEGGFRSGDFNGDHVVNAADAAIQVANWGSHVAAESAAVPEPGTIVLLLGFAMAAIAWRPRR